MSATLELLIRQSRNGIAPRSERLEGEGERTGCRTHYDTNLGAKHLVLDEWGEILIG